MSDASAADNQKITDAEHLRMLVIFHYVVGVIMIGMSSLFIMHIVFGLILIFNPDALADLDPSGKAPPAFFGYFAIVGGCIAITVGWTLGGLTVFSGRCIQHRKHRTLSLIMAGLMCAFMPLGSILGVLTFVVLFRDSVKKLYDNSAIAAY